MKKLINYGHTLILFALFFNINAAYAQYEWAPIGAEWYFDRMENGQSGDYLYSRYVSTKDTLIEGKLCRLVTNGSDTEYFYQDAYKVYYWQNNKFNLLYVFDAKLNDTLTLDLKTSKSLLDRKNYEGDTTLAVKCVLRQIDTIFFNEETIRLFILKRIPIEGLEMTSGSFAYAERVGNPSEFIETLRGSEPPEMSRALRCYSDNDISYKSEWSFYNYPCDSVLSIEEESKYDLAYVYPNPCLDFINIELLQLEDIGNLKISIIDFRGKKVMDSKIDCTTEQIDLSELKPGSYYIQITDLKQNKIQSHKIIKQ